GWIVVYVVGFGNADVLSVAIGVPKLITVLLGLVLTALLVGFMRGGGLLRRFGLCKAQGRCKDYLYYLPLALLSCVNLFGGLAADKGMLESVLFVVSMCLVALLEELIFRGLLFKGMLRSGVRSAVVLSSLAFGAGHIVNLLLGASLGETLLQLCYAAAVGFCYTALFYASGSILPCVLSHAFVNATSGFAAELGGAANTALALGQSAIAVGYGLWLLRRAKRSGVPERAKD
ncbi:MAG: CPBP family intramembrane metalloprotease, partial [Eubacteriales bacterium]|nr:CPBP family intramembrane metalloprotease [Eubacteriales bacterium]